MCVFIYYTNTYKIFITTCDFWSLNSLDGFQYVDPSTCMYVLGPLPYSSLQMVEDTPYTTKILVPLNLTFPYHRQCYKVVVVLVIL